MLLIFQLLDPILIEIVSFITSNQATTNNFPSTFQPANLLVEEPEK